MGFGDVRVDLASMYSAFTCICWDCCDANCFIASAAGRGQNAGCLFLGLAETHVHPVHACMHARTIIWPFFFLAPLQPGLQHVLQMGEHPSPTLVCSKEMFRAPLKLRSAPSSSAQKQKACEIPTQ